MKLVGNTVFIAAIVLALSSVAKAEALYLPDATYLKLMSLFDRLASAQIISSVLAASIIGISAIICCLILKKKK